MATTQAATAKDRQEQQPLATVKPLPLRPYQASPPQDALGEALDSTTPSLGSLREHQQHLAASQYASLVVGIPRSTVEGQRRGTEGMLRQLQIRDKTTMHSLAAATGPSLDALVATSLDDKGRDRLECNDESSGRGDLYDQVYPTAFASTSPPPSTTLKSSQQRSSSVSSDSWRSLLPPTDPYSLSAAPTGGTSTSTSIIAAPSSISPTPSLISHASSSVATSARGAPTPTNYSSSPRTSFSLPEHESWRTLLPDTDPAAWVPFKDAAALQSGNPCPPATRWSVPDISSAGAQRAYALSRAPGPQHQNYVQNQDERSRTSSASSGPEAAAHGAHSFDAYAGFGFAEGSSRAAFNPLYFSSRVRSQSAREAEASGCASASQGAQGYGYGYGGRTGRKDRHYSFNGVPSAYTTGSGASSGGKGFGGYRAQQRALPTLVACKATASSDADACQGEHGQGEGAAPVPVPVSPVSPTSGCPPSRAHNDAWGGPTADPDLDLDLDLDLETPRVSASATGVGVVGSFSTSPTSLFPGTDTGMSTSSASPDPRSLRRPSVPRSDVSGRAEGIDKEREPASAVGASSWTLRTLQNRYVCSAPLREYGLSDITLATMDRTLLVVAQKGTTASAVASDALPVASLPPRFEQRFTLPPDADMGSVKAEFDGRILSVLVERSVEEEASGLVGGPSEGPRLV